MAETQRPRWEERPPDGNLEFLRAFPAALHHEVSVVIPAFPPCEIRLNETFTALVDGEGVVIPSRIYIDRPDPLVESQLSPLQRTVLRCIYSRHHDGHVRQDSLERIVGTPYPWVAPFVVQLIGEYVVEILIAIQAGLDQLGVEGSSQRLVYGNFVRENPAYMDRTARRVTSYWDCYYRSQYPKLADYPGTHLLGALRMAALDSR